MRETMTLAMSASNFRSGGYKTPAFLLNPFQACAP